MIKIAITDRAWYHCYRYTRSKDRTGATSARITCGAWLPKASNAKVSLGSKWIDSCIKCNKTEINLNLGLLVGLYMSSQVPYIVIEQWKSHCMVLQRIFKMHRECRNYRNNEIVATNPNVLKMITFSVSLFWSQFTSSLHMYWRFLDIVHSLIAVRRFCRNR